MLNLIWQHDAKRIWNDEVIKQFVYLVSKIDWVITDYGSLNDSHNV